MTLLQDSMDVARPFRSNAKSDPYEDYQKLEYDGFKPLSMDIWEGHNSDQVMSPQQTSHTPGHTSQDTFPDTLQDTLPDTARSDQKPKDTWIPANSQRPEAEPESNHKTNQNGVCGFMDGMVDMDAKPLPKDTLTEFVAIVVFWDYLLVFCE